MKKIALLPLGILSGILLTIGFLWMGSSPKALADLPQPLTTTTPIPAAGEAQPADPIQSLSGDDEHPSTNNPMSVQAASALPTPVPGETQVYFTTADSDATATVLFLYNTDAVDHVVALRGYSYSGVLGYSLNINVGAGSFVRLTSDSVAAAPPPSWATPAPIVTNFTDFTYFASLSLPKGVKVEGYTLFNPGTGTVDPRLDQGAIPIRFSTDPAAIFLPSVQSVP
jgi:hypothetical protein